MHLPPISSPSHLPHPPPTIDAVVRRPPMKSFDFSTLFAWNPLPRSGNSDITSWAHVRRLTWKGNEAAVVLGTEPSSLEDLSSVQKAAVVDFLVDTYVRHRSNMPFNRIAKKDKRILSKGASEFEVQKEFNTMLVEGSVSFFLRGFVYCFSFLNSSAFFRLYMLCYSED